MKIGLLIHDINNLGGIITYVERLAKGFIESGHNCDILKLVYQEKVSESRVRNKDYRLGETDLLVHPIFGWSFPAKNRIAYKGEAIKSALEKLNEYDLLIWETPAPSVSVNKDKRENLEWFQLFKNNSKQILTIHDGNLLKLYPHIIYALNGIPNLTVTAPHPRGFNSAKHLDLNQTLIMIPQYPPDKNIQFETKQKGFLACHVFKAWKHMDELVKSISYMKPLENSSCKMRAIAGIGLQYYYMTSKDKCKFFWEDGSRVWDTALANGMQYLGVLGFKERDEILSKSLLSIDPSYVNDGIGNHLNGSVAESIRMGCIPVGKPLTFRESENDNEAIYQPGRNYLEIPQNATLQEYAECLEDFSSTNKEKWDTITETNYGILENWFDYRKVAQQLIDQAFIGVENSRAMKYNLGKGSPSQELLTAARKTITTFNASS